MDDYELSSDQRRLSYREDAFPILKGCSVFLKKKLFVLQIQYRKLSSD
jgi:hypothetical protein